jgi:DNA-binding transcriptional ArsR family regulator
MTAILELTEDYYRIEICIPTKECFRVSDIVIMYAPLTKTDMSIQAYSKHLKVVNDSDVVDLFKCDKKYLVSVFNLFSNKTLSNLTDIINLKHIPQKIEKKEMIKINRIKEMRTKLSDEDNIAELMINRLFMDGRMERTVYDVMLSDIYSNQSSQPNQLNMNNKIELI